MCWASSLECAGWFADRVKEQGTPVVVSTVAPVDHQLMHSNCRNELETVLAPERRPFEVVAEGHTTAKLAAKYKEATS
jgi:hypothetical protein